MKQSLVVISSPTEHINAVCTGLQNFGFDVSQTTQVNYAEAGLALQISAFILLDVDMKESMSILLEIYKDCLYPPPYIIVAGTFSNGSDCTVLLNLGADACINTGT